MKLIMWACVFALSIAVFEREMQEGHVRMRESPAHLRPDIAEAVPRRNLSRRRQGSYILLEATLPRRASTELSALRAVGIWPCPEPPSPSLGSEQLTPNSSELIVCSAWLVWLGG